MILLAPTHGIRWLSPSGVEISSRSLRGSLWVKSWTQCSFSIWTFWKIAQIPPFLICIHKVNENIYNLYSQIWSELSKGGEWTPLHPRDSGWAPVLLLATNPVRSSLEEQRGARRSKLNLSVLKLVCSKWSMNMKKQFKEIYSNLRKAI